MGITITEKKLGELIAAAVHKEITKVMATLPAFELKTLSNTQVRKLYRIGSESHWVKYRVKHKIPCHQIAGSNRITFLEHEVYAHMQESQVNFKH